MGSSRKISDIPMFIDFIMKTLVFHGKNGCQVTYQSEIKQNSKYST